MGLHEYQAFVSHNTYDVPKELQNESPLRIMEKYFESNTPRGFEFDLLEQDGKYYVKHNVVDRGYELKEWLDAVRTCLEKSDQSGPFHIYIEMKRIKDTRKFPQKFDEIISSAFKNSKIEVFTQKDFKEHGNRFPDPAELKNKVIFQISGSAGEITPLKPICSIAYYICQRFCSLFSAKKNYDKWKKEDKQAFTDITGYNFKSYKNRVFMNFPDFMITNRKIPEILEEQKKGRIVRTFLADDRFMKSPKSTVANLLAIHVDPLNKPSRDLTKWSKKPDTMEFQLKKGEWNLMDKKAFKWVWWIGFLSIFWFLAFTTASILVFPGGYDFWHYFLSDLGMLKVYNGEMNELGHTLFSIAIYGFSAAQIVFHLGTWSKIYRYSTHDKKLVFAAKWFGIASAVMFALVAYFPKSLDDPTLNIHSIVANLFGFLTFGIMIPWYIMVTNENNTKWELIAGYLPGVCYLLSVILFLFGHLAPDGSGYQETVQKVFIAAYIYWYFTLCYWMYQKNLKMVVEP